MCRRTVSQSLRDLGALHLTCRAELLFESSESAVLSFLKVCYLTLIQHQVLLYSGLV